MKTVKKPLAIFMSMLLCIIAIPLGAVSVSAKTYDTLTYELENEEVSITDCDESATYVQIPDEIDGYPVTNIGESAFYNCTSLTSITIPDSVTSINDRAFRDCESLTSITIPDSVIHIGYWTFSNCTSLESITIPDSVEHIESAVFENTIWYKNQPNGLVYAGMVAYDYKGTMSENTEIVLKEGTKGIASNAFSGNVYLGSIIIPDSVTNIGYNAFYGCTSLKSITIPDSITSIENKTFYNCTSLASITIPDSVTSIGNDVFLNCADLTIYGYAGSVAETYATDNSIPFVALDENLSAGDLNGDGTISVADILLLKKYIFGKSMFSVNQAKAADLNDDGIINAFDLVLMKKTLLNK